jgi:hypothetical protein
MSVRLPKAAFPARFFVTNDSIHFSHAGKGEPVRAAELAVCAKKIYKSEHL